MKIHLQIILVFAAIVALSGCSPGISGGSEETSAGNADFSSFVAIGDSLTAGYADGAQYRDIQLNSLALILAQQFALAGGGGIDQPLMPVGATGSLNYAGTDLGRANRLALKPTGDPANPLSPQTYTPVQSTDIQVRIAGAGMFNNMGVPGMKSFHMSLPGYGSLLPGAPGVSSSPYFARFASSDTTTYVADAAALVPSFFLFWVGNNDVLLYAIDGGGTQNAVPPYGTSTDDITNPAVFDAAYNGALATVKTATNKGLLVNIPDVKTLPYFTTVPYNAIPLDATQASDANIGFSVYNGFLQTIVAPSMSACPFRITQEEADRRTISFAAGQNAVVILDENLTDLTACNPALVSMRQATAEDFILLPAASKLGEVAPSPPFAPGSIWGISAPLQDEDVLIDTEAAAVENARQAYNATIKAAADADPDLVFFDAAAKLTELNDSGLNYGTGSVTSTFATGGFYSLDGIHPTARGYAITANEMFKAINAGFDAFIPAVDPNEYPTVTIQ